MSDETDASKTVEVHSLENILLCQHGRSDGYRCSRHASGVDFACRSDRNGDRYGGGSHGNIIDRRNRRTTNRTFIRTCSTVTAHRNVTTRTQTRIYGFCEAHHTLIILGGNAGAHGDGHCGHGRGDFRRVGNWKGGSHGSHLWPIRW